ncbi:MAG: hypothetical protein H8D26_07565 [Methanomicrobia archaeon]|nr:hypothetical protein [Methanomicrobia archaeon]
MQGDFIKECPVIIPPSEISDEVEVRIINYDVVIMSQSCDLVQRKLDLVLVCPIWPLREFEERSDFFKSRKGKEELRQGNVPGYHLLNKCEIDRFQTDYLVVDFRSVYSVPFDFVIDLVKRRGKRLRLLSPYREHLSQAFARFFMRVGLPVDIPPFR